MNRERALSLLRNAREGRSVLYVGYPGDWKPIMDMLSDRGEFTHWIARNHVITFPSMGVFRLMSMDAPEYQVQGLMIDDAWIDENCTNLELMQEIVLRVGRP